MASSTSVYHFPYPQSTDPPDGPLAVRNLAEALEANLILRTGPGVGTVYTRMVVGRTTGNADASGNILFAHGLGVKPKYMFFQTGQAAMSPLLQAVGKIIWNEGATDTVYGWAVYMRTDVGGYLGNNPYEMFWTAYA